MSAFLNRLKKNSNRLLPWSKKHLVEAYRIYDRDIPEYPYILDRYGAWMILYDRRESIDRAPERASRFEEVVQAVKLLMTDLGLDLANLVIKERSIQTPDDQYRRLSSTERKIEVQETQARFLVNLWDYVDTGLFLDHRLVRQWVHDHAVGKKVLNLFSYTGSISVFAALAGAQVTSVDLSNTYLEWSKENFDLNKIPLSQHRFVAADVLEWLKLQVSKGDAEKYDVIVLDPPTFSNSKKMDGTLDIERDHVQLVRDCLSLLKPKGQLLFSNNKRGFRLDPSLNNVRRVVDLTGKTLPRDFHDNKIRKVFLFCE